MKAFNYTVVIPGWWQTCFILQGPQKAKLCYTVCLHL